MTRLLSAVFLLSLLAGGVAAAQEGAVPTQMLVTLDPNSQAPTDASAITVEVNGRKEPLAAWQPLAPGKAQVALLIDDGLRESIGREMGNLEAFVRGLPPGVEVMVGFMEYGHVVAAQGFTTDHAAAANSLHLPQGMPDASASPYICVSDFVRHWPGGETAQPAALNGAPQRKARLVLMISNGVDPYNGSTSVMNQDSPYVTTAVADAQRAGVAVSAIYFSDAGMRGESADNSGQNYLSQLAENSGGISFWQGVGNPVSLAPFLKQFQQTLAETYIATFPAPVGRNPRQDLVRVKISAPHVRLHAPSEVLPGNRD